MVRSGTTLRAMDLEAPRTKGHRAEQEMPPKAAEGDGGENLGF